MLQCVVAASSVAHSHVRLLSLVATARAATRVEWEVRGVLACRTRGVMVCVCMIECVVRGVIACVTCGAMVRVVSGATECVMHRAMAREHRAMVCLLCGAMKCVILKSQFATKLTIQNNSEADFSEILLAESRDALGSCVSDALHNGA